mmetsp:Transcript_7549/g.15175  ORF Transcript_7549/g.15175 Transcript_7549/m.15175 type:complete len:163 (+) Transcript_7549:163-651(+)
MDQQYEEIDVRTKIDEYSSFINTTLRPQLESAVKAREDVERDIKEYESLQSKLCEMTRKKSESAEKVPMETLADLGHELVYSNAVVDDPGRIYVHVGMGFHVEMTIEEADAFVKKRIKYLENELMEHKTHRATTIAVHIEETLLVLQELGKEASMEQQRENK